MKFAWIEDGRIRDIAHSNPNDIYHPDVAKFYDTQVPDEAENGDFWENGTLKKQPKPEDMPPPPPAPRQWTQDDFRKNMTLAEKVKWDNDTAPEIKTVKAEMASPKELAAVTELLQFLVDSGVISQASMDKILA